MPDTFQARFKAPFATLGITTTDTHLTGVRFLPADTPAQVPRRNSIAYLTCVQLGAYLENPLFEFDVPIHLAGTRHRLEVWEAMCRIPAGQVRTYGQVALELRSSARAVGGACGANPVPLVIPCHRIVAANGALGGFMGSRHEGFELGIKRWLLGHEGAL